MRPSPSTGTRSRQPRAPPRTAPRSSRRLAAIPTASLGDRRRDRRGRPQSHDGGGCSIRCSRPMRAALVDRRACGSARSASDRGCAPARSTARICASSATACCSRSPRRSSSAIVLAAHQRGARSRSTRRSSPAIASAAAGIVSYVVVMLGYSAIYQGTVKLDALACTPGTPSRSTTWRCWTASPPKARRARRSAKAWPTRSTWAASDDDRTGPLFRRHDQRAPRRSPSMAAPESLRILGADGMTIASNGPMPICARSRRPTT